MTGRIRRWVMAAALAILAAPILTPTADAAAKPNPKLADPGLRSAAAVIVDARNGGVLYERKPSLVAPIASITKLMLALVVLEGKQPLDEVIEVTKEDRWTGKGAYSRLPIGAKITRSDLLLLALMASENRASHTLARNYPGGIPEFVKTMNLKAKALGMTQTHFDDPSGLSNGNVSSARDLVKLITAAAREPVIRDFSTQRRYEVRTGRKSVIEFRNTNLLIGRPDWDIVVQKTGFTNDAGECLAMQAVLNDRPVTMVFLNSFGKLTRTADARRVRKWIEAQEAVKVAAR